MNDKQNGCLQSCFDQQIRSRKIAVFQCNSVLTAFLNSLYLTFFFNIVQGAPSLTLYPMKPCEWIDTAANSSQNWAEICLRFPSRYKFKDGLSTSDVWQTNQAKTNFGQKFIKVSDLYLDELFVPDGYLVLGR